jgi:hypothetical protein
MCIEMLRLQYMGKLNAKGMGSQAMLSVAFPNERCKIWLV